MAGPVDRRRLLAMAHMAAAQLGLDEEERRWVQQAVVGKASCAQMSAEELQRLIQHYQRMGTGVWQTASRSRSPLLRKIAAQCLSAGYPFPQYALGIARQMLGIPVDRLEWVPEPTLRKIVAALTYWQKRKRQEEVL